MKTFLRAGLLLLPLILFWQLGADLVASAAGAALALTVAIVSMRKQMDPLLPWSLAAVLSAAAALWALQVATDARLAAATVSLAAGLMMLAGVFIGRPWTGPPAAPDWPGMTSDPIFLQVNQLLSSLWGVVICWSGIALLVNAGPAARWVPMALAGVASALLPEFLTHRLLERRLKAADPHPWPSPLLSTPTEAVDVDVAIVGSGIGGLTAAALLARAGAKVAVYEQHDKPGGFCHNWDGVAALEGELLTFRFDAGVHDISGLFEGGTVHALLKRLNLGDSIEWLRLDHGFADDAGRWDVPRGWDAYTQAMVRRFPGQEAALRGALADVRDIHAAMYATAATRGGVPGAPATATGLIAFARIHPLAVQWMDKPFSSLLKHHGVVAEAQARLLGLSLYVTHRPEALLVREYVPILGYFLHGGHYPLGGSGVLSQWLVDSVRLDGGEVYLDTPVDKVLMAEGGTAVTGLRLQDGHEIRAKAVVLNGDLAGFARTMLPEGALPEGFRRQLNGLEPATSMFMVHLGIRGELPALPPVTHLEHEGVSMEIVLPSLVDPSAAPAGYNTIELMQLVAPEAAFEWFEQPNEVDPHAQRNSAAYLERKARTADTMIDAAARLIPGLRDRIVFRREASPLTFRRYGYTTHGAVYGVDGSFSQVARRSPVAGLVFAGAATRGPGVEAAMISGAEAADALLPGLLAADRRLVARQ